MDAFVIKSEPRDKQECCVENCEYQRTATDDNPIVLNAFPMETILREIWSQKIQILSPNWDGITHNSFVCHSHLLKFTTLKPKPLAKTTSAGPSSVPQETVTSTQAPTDVRPVKRIRVKNELNEPHVKRIKVEELESNQDPVSSNMEFILPNVKEEIVSDDETTVSSASLVKEEPIRIQVQELSNTEEPTNESHMDSGPVAKVNGVKKVKKTPMYKEALILPKQRTVRLQVKCGPTKVDQMSQTDPPKSIAIQCNIIDSDESSESSGDDDMGDSPTNSS